MNRNNQELKKYVLKMRVRRLLPNWFLKLIRRRQVPLTKLLKFKEDFESKTIDQPTRVENIAVVVPGYNHSEFLPLAFASIIKQTRLPEQVVLIDDCSHDDTYETIQKLVSGYQNNNPESKIEFIVQKNDLNLGQALTLNKAINLARTDLVMILNDDDYLMHDAVAIILDTFKRKPELALVGSGNIAFSGNDFLTKQNKIASTRTPINYNLTVRQPEEALAYENFCDLNMTHTGSTFSRVKALSVGLYRPLKDRIVRFSDRDFQIRLNLLYPVATYYQLPLCFWREDSSQDSGLNS